MSILLQNTSNLKLTFSDDFNILQFHQTLSNTYQSKTVSFVRVASILTQTAVLNISLIGRRQRKENQYEMVLYFLLLTKSSVKLLTVLFEILLLPF